MDDDRDVQTSAPDLRRSTEPLAVMLARYRDALERLGGSDPYAAAVIRHEIERLRDAIEAPQRAFPVAIVRR